MGQKTLRKSDVFPGKFLYGYQWQDGGAAAAESTINSIMMIAKTVMAESGLGGRFWFKVATVQPQPKMTAMAAMLHSSLFQSALGMPLNQL